MMVDERLLREAFFFGRNLANVFIVLGLCKLKLTKPDLF